MKHAPVRKFRARVLAACLGLWLLAGCSAGTDLDSEVAEQLQQRVAEAKQHAARQDFPAAQAELQQLSRDVATAAGLGRMSEQRKSRIEAAIGSISNDLAAAMAPAPQPSATATLTEEHLEQAEEARKEAEEQREKAQEEAEELRKEAEKKLEEAQKEAEKKRGNG